MTTTSAPMFIDFTRNINNLKDMIIFELTNLLNRYNLDRLDLIPYKTDEYGRVYMPNYFYKHRGTIQLPRFEYCDCGDFEVAHMYAIVKKGNKWIAYWTDDSCDYEALTPEACEDETDFSLRELNDYVMLYNRVYAILTNPNLFEEEKKRIEDETERGAKEHQQRLAEIRKQLAEPSQEDCDALTQLKQVIEAQ